jgi:Family of unknown function (DUF6526)
METQNFEKHTQHDIFLYILTVVVIVLWVLLSVIAKKIDSVVPLHGLQYIMPFLVPLFLIALLMKMRRYATTLQDRIIRQEVQFRYFVATGKVLPASITLSQIIGLRFAWDAEFIELTNQVALHPERSSKDIKKQVKHWKGDFNRV